jgi:hypothetical protein
MVIIKPFNTALTIKINILLDPITRIIITCSGAYIPIITSMAFYWLGYYS